MSGTAELTSQPSRRRGASPSHRDGRATSPSRARANTGRPIRSRVKATNVAVNRPTSPMVVAVRTSARPSAPETAAAPVTSAAATVHDEGRQRHPAGVAQRGATLAVGRHAAVVQPAQPAVGQAGDAVEHDRGDDEERGGHGQLRAPTGTELARPSVGERTDR